MRSWVGPEALDHREANAGDALDQLTVPGLVADAMELGQVLLHAPDEERDLALWNEHDRELPIAVPPRRGQLDAGCTVFEALELEIEARRALEFQIEPARCFNPNRHSMLTPPFDLGLDAVELALQSKAVRIPIHGSGSKLRATCGGRGEGLRLRGSLDDQMTSSIDHALHHTTSLQDVVVASRGVLDDGARARSPGHRMTRQPDRVAPRPWRRRRRRARCPRS